MRRCLLAMLLLVPLTSAHAFTPISGPNDAIPSPVCDIINFGFCPQPPAPPPPFPDPEADLVARRPAPASLPAAHARVHRRRHLHE